MVRVVARDTAEFTAVLEAVPDAVVCVAPDGRISFANALAGQLFGYPPAELAGLPVEVLIPESAQARHRQYREAYLAAPWRRPMGAAQAELAGRRRDGSTFRAEVSLAPIPAGDDGQPGVLAAVRDITERVAAQQEHARLEFLADRAQLERQVSEAQRLEGLGQLAGGIAHDFNNLLSVISSYASFVHEEVASEAAAGKWRKVSQDLEELENAADRAAALTRQLLAYSRTQQAEPQVLDFNEVVEGLAELLTRTLGGRVVLALDLDPGIGRVLADCGQLEQVLVNLAVNARDAMPGGGRLTIRTAAAQLDDPDVAAGLAAAPGGQPGQFVRLEVSDTGAGMSPEVASQVFEPFFTTKPAGQGTGLGLATVHGIIRRAGGRLEVSSAPGQGTTMTVLLPVTEAAARQPAAPVPEQPLRGSGEIVLVVEDETSIREATRRVLAGHGYRVLTAAGGEEALALAARQPEPIDVLLTDVMMPNMLGTEVADRLRDRQPGLPVLFMSGYTQGLLGAQGTLQPGMELIEKPFTHPDLLAKLREVLAAPAGERHG